MWEHKGTENNKIGLSDEAAVAGLGVASVHEGGHVAGIPVFSPQHAAWHLRQISWKDEKYPPAHMPAFHAAISLLVENKVRVLLSVTPQMCVRVCRSFILSFIWQ